MDKELSEYLQSFDTFAGKEQEGINYLNESSKRFMLTSDLIPDKKKGGRMLELGANPYFLTLMLKRSSTYDIRTANFLEEDDSTHQGVQTINSRKYNETHRFEYDHFNVETDPFPYEDGSFDVVLCCEILEHLLKDPTHMLCEIQRILKDGGTLILTTPNVNRWTNIRKLLKNKNIYDAYSGYGPYGRHNREYSMDETTHLISGCGFTIDSAERLNIYEHKRLDAAVMMLHPSWCDHLFIRAKKDGGSRFFYPEDIYRSMYGLLEPIDDYVMMGHNDVFHISSGWYGLEDWPPLCRWMMKESVLNLKAKGGERRMTASIFVPEPLVNNEFAVKVTIGDESRETRSLKQGWQEITLDFPSQQPGEIECRIEVSDTWTPSSGGRSKDSRSLGIAVSKVGFEISPSLS